MLRKYIVSIFIMFIYLFAVNVTFLPSMISTRWFLALPGIILMFLYYEKLNRKSFRYRKTTNSYFRGVFVFYFIIISSGVLNGGFDGTYSAYPITMIILATSSFCLVYLLNRIWNSIDLQRYMWLFVLSCLIHQLLSIIMFFVPEINDAVFSIIKQSALEERANEITMANRFHTIGVSYFGAGVIYSYAIYFMAILSQSRHFNVKGWIGIVLVLFLFMVGSAVSRTTIVGFIFALGYIGLIFLKSSGSEKIKRFFKYSLIGIITISITIFIFNKYFIDDALLGAVIEHAFEGFFNLVNERTFYTSSSDKMFSAYVWPDSLWTWVIGDAKLNGVDEYSYYMFTDIGWCRLVFAFGVLGTMTFCAMQWRLLKCVFTYRLNYVVTFMLMLSFLFKGISELTVYFMPAAMISLFNNNKSIL